MRRKDYALRTFVRIYLPWNHKTINLSEILLSPIIEISMFVKINLLSTIYTMFLVLVIEVFKLMYY